VADATPIRTFSQRGARLQFERNGRPDVGAPESWRSYQFPRHEMPGGSEFFAEDGGGLVRPLQRGHRGRGGERRRPRRRWDRELCAHGGVRLTWTAVSEITSCAGELSPRSFASSLTSGAFASSPGRPNARAGYSRLEARPRHRPPEPLTQTDLQWHVHQRQQRKRLARLLPRLLRPSLRCQRGRPSLSRDRTQDESPSRRTGRASWP